MSVIAPRTLATLSDLTVSAGILDPEFDTDTNTDPLDMMLVVGPNTIKVKVTAEMYVNAQAWGTPQQILDKLSHWRAVVGRFDLIFGFRGAGMPFEDAERSQRLIAQKVIPELRQWDVEAKAA